MDSNFKVHFEATGLDEVNTKLDAYGAKLTSLKEKTDKFGNVSYAATGKVVTGQEQVANATDRAANATNRAGKAQSSYFGHIAKTTVQSALINQLFLQFVDVAGQAVEQVDLMNNFPATMASMGQSTEDAGKAFQSLRDYVGATGANLGQAVSMVTRFTGVTNDVKAATAIYQGLNNALIAGDTTLEEQKNAAIQFGQALERGKPDMREWNTLSTVMSQQLGIVAEKMGYVNANELGQSLRDGEESMSAFTTELTKLSTTGVIAEQARARMNGMQFAFGVMKNTLVQGVAQIINAFGRSNIVAFFTLITATIKVLVGWIIILMNAFVSLFNLISGLVGGPQLQKITGDTAAMSDNVNDAAGGADDLGKGLKKAGKEADKINKSLASFDKMNVLADKTSGKDKGDDTGAGSKFDAGQLAELGSLGNPFADMTKGLENANFLAKILAGVLAGLAANALINKIFGVNVLKEFGKALWKHAIIPLGTNFGGALKTAGQGLLNFGRGLTGFGANAGAISAAESLGLRMAIAIKTGLSSLGTGVTTVLRTFLIAPLITVLGTIGTYVAIVFGGVALAASLPLWAVVAIGAAVVAAIVGIFWLIWTNWDKIWGFIKDVARSFWEWLVGIWNTLYDIFAGPVKFLWQVVEGVFIAIVAIIAIALELIFKLWAGMVMLVFNLLKTIAGWINENVIQPVWQFFQGLWDNITKSVVAAWQWIFENVLRPIGSWISTNVITPVLNIFKGLWNSSAGFASGFFETLKTILGAIWGWIKDNVVDRIAGLFSGLWDGIKNGLSGMMNGLKSIFGGITEIFKTPLNGIIDLINKAIDGVNRLKVPDWVPQLGGKTPGIPKLPRLARGGIVEEATIAMIGERGKEAVVPLENNTEWIDKLAQKINSTTGGNGQPIQLTVQIGEEKVASKVIELINEKTQMSGRNMIYV